jgi:AraC-like DNA-binding protein
MGYDVRENYYTFKYIADQKPEVNPDLYKEHFHTSYELLYFLAGNGDFIIQHCHYKLTPHTLLVIPPGAYHNLLLHSESPYERIVLRFNEVDIPKDLRQQMKAVNGVYKIGGTRLSEELFRLATLHKELSSELILQIFKSQLNVIIAYLCQCSRLNLHADYQNEDVRRIISYINENLPSISSMEQICSQLHMSRSLLQKRFYEHLKTPVMSYVRTQKCMLAQSLLRKGLPATSVYLQCGFNDYSSFYRAYVKVFHHSPTGQGDA